MKSIRTTLVAMTVALISGCALDMQLEAPQPDRLVNTQIMEGIEFHREDGKVNVAPRFMMSIDIVGNDLTEARKNLLKEGMNMCWQISAGKFFIIGDERVALRENDNTLIVWKIACDPVGYAANKTDNRRILSPARLIKYGPKTL